MSFIVSFVDYTPEPRFDGVSWNRVIVQEGPSADGPWTDLETIDVGVDVDPENPQPRNFTTTLATLEFGWYRIVWIDQAANQQATPPVQRFAQLAYRPSLTDLGTLDIARTRDDVGNQLGTFNDKTTPTDEQANRLIDKALQDLRPKIGTEIPADLNDDVKDLVALRAAMFLELSYYGTEVAQNRSPYPQYKELFDEKLPSVIAAIEAEEAGADVTDSVTDAGNFPAFSFPSPTDWLTRPM